MAIVKKIFVLLAAIFARVEETLLCFLLLAMILLACVQIFLRVFYSSGILWADPLLRYMVIWAGLLGAAVATKHSKHISIDIISHLVPPRLLPLLQVLLDFFSASVCIILTYAAVSFVRDEALYGTRTVLAIPSWALNSIYPLAFCIIGGRFLILGIKGLVRTARPEPSPGRT